MACEAVIGWVFPPLFLVVQLERALSRPDVPPVRTVRSVDIPYCIYYNPILRGPKQTHVIKFSLVFLYYPGNYARIAYKQTCAVRHAPCAMGRVSLSLLP